MWSFQVLEYSLAGYCSSNSDMTWSWHVVTICWYTCWYDAERQDYECTCALTYPALVSSRDFFTERLVLRKAAARQHGVRSTQAISHHQWRALELCALEFCGSRAPSESHHARYLDKFKDDYPKARALLLLSLQWCLQHSLLHSHLRGERSEKRWCPSSCDRRSPNSRCQLALLLSLGFQSWQFVPQISHFTVVHRVVGRGFDRWVCNSFCTTEDSAVLGRMKKFIEREKHGATHSRIWFCKGDWFLVSYVWTCLLYLACEAAHWRRHESNGVNSRNVQKNWTWAKS